jgi:hypothetical protein
LLDTLPAISPRMIANAAASLRDSPLSGLLVGAFSGTPYKVFAAVAQEARIGWPAFLAVSIPARACRFLGVILLTWAADQFAARWLADRTRRWLLTGFWVAFYAAFWSLAEA